jgi:hypothetical protein
MSVQDLARFLERLGHHVVETPSSLWYDVGPRFYLNFPHYPPVEPGPEELSGFFRRLALGVRYFAPAGGPGRPSYALVCRDKAYDIERLGANARSKLRRGLRRCRVERLDPAYVRAHGRRAEEDTMRRTRTRPRHAWDAYWRAVEASSGVEVWGAFVDDTLAAYALGGVAAPHAEIWDSRSITDLLRHYPNNAVIYTMVRDLLSRPDIEQVCFGVEPVEDVGSLEQFKESMGFARTPVRQHVVLHPVLGRVARGRAVRRLVEWRAAHRPESEFWRKCSAVLALADGNDRAPSGAGRADAVDTGGGRG